MTRELELTYPAPAIVQLRSRECTTSLYRVMKIVGYLPPETGFKRYVYLVWTCFIFGLSGLYLLIGYALNLSIGINNFTPGEVLTLGETFLSTVGATAKDIIGIIFLTRLHEMMLLMDKLDEMLTGDSDREKINKAVAFCNYIFLMYGKLYLCYTISGILVGVFNGQPPWNIYNPFFDWRVGVVYFWMQLAIESFIGPMAVAMVLIWDTCFLLFLIICRAHVDVLKNHIRNLRTDSSKTEAENYEDLVKCIVYHKKIISCCDLMRPVVSLNIFVQFLLIGLVLGLTLINIMLFSGVLRGLPAIVLLIAALFQSFPFCYLCDLIVEDCEDLSNLLAQTQWVDAQPRYNATLKIFLQHLQQPIMFNAGGIFPVSMSNNIKMAKFAFSVMTILQEMNLAERFK